MANILVIAYDFPPILSPESIQSQRFVLKLLKEGHNVVVLTTHTNPDFETIDTQLLDKKIDIIRTKKLFLEKYRHIFYKLLGIVDRKLWWRDIAFKTAKKIIQKQNINKIITRSVPFSDHIVGYKLKKELNIEWVSHFSDPWSMNPYDKRGIVFRLIDSYLEKKILHLVDSMSVTSQKTKELYLQKYKHLNIVIYPHLYEEALYKNRKNKSKKIVITHTGNIYGLRSIKKILEVLKECKRNDIEFRFYGKIKKEELELVKRWNLEAKVKIFDTISYRDSLDKMKESDYLLVVEAPLENSPFFPSKLVDYMGAKRPIVLYGVKNSTSFKILEQYTEYFVFIDSKDSIKDFLTKVQKIEYLPIKKQEDLFSL